MQGDAGPGDDAAKKARLVAQLQETLESATEANRVLARAKAAALRPPDDPKVIAACDKAMATNDEVIDKCNSAIADAIVARPGFEAFMTKLGALTEKMDADSAALDAAVSSLDGAKKLGKTAAGILDLFL
jgi:exonuclease VII small subunit